METRYVKAIVTHGGAGSDKNDSDGPAKAATLGMRSMEGGGSALDSAVIAVRHLEDDPRFNAGVGSQLRCDGKTIQLDASCMMSDGRFGGVACVEGIENPITIAKEVLGSHYVLLTGHGAIEFANAKGVPLIKQRSSTETQNPKNNCDTVGAVTFDGIHFAAALSSGGLERAALGRVGDVPLPGCGLFCGDSGAIACTGDGEFIALKLLAREVYGWIEQGVSALEAALRAIALFESTVDIGLIILTKSDFAAESRHSMACGNRLEKQ